MEIRELIFRGFHPCDGPDAIVVDGKKVNGMWVYGNYLTDSNGDTYITAYPFTPISPNYKDQWRVGAHVPVIRVDPSTVGQYTGLTDKSGTQIFEGDILNEFGEHFTVVYDSDWAKFKLQYHHAVQFPEWNRGVLMEVIGTVFDEVHHE